MLKMPEDEALALWVAYNQRLLDQVFQEDDVLWFNYDYDPSHIEAWLRWVGGELGLRVTPKA